VLITWQRQPSSNNQGHAKSRGRKPSKASRQLSGGARTADALLEILVSFALGRVSFALFLGVRQTTSQFILQFRDHPSSPAISIISQAKSYFRKSLFLEP